MCEATKAVDTSCRATLKRGTRLGAASLGLLFLASSLTMPHLQSRRDELGCDSMCLGSLASGRSLLNLVGATVMGGFSDSHALDEFGGARRILLWVGVAAAAMGILMANQATSVRQLYWSLVPGAFEQNIHILKALFSDYHDATPEASTPGERASSSGVLGMSVGLAMMFGPVAGANILTTYEAAVFGALGVLIVAAFLIALLPTPQRIPPKLMRKKSTFLNILDVPSARTPAALFLLSCRLLSTLSYHTYQTILTTSLRDRFGFGPKQYGAFFSTIGLVYAVSQGFMARWLIDRFAKTPRERTILVVVSSFVITAMRYLAFYSTQLPLVYGMFAVMVVAYGVLSTLFAADTTQIPSREEVGAFFGLLAAVESGAGMAGPLLGGFLSYYHPTKAPLLAVVVFGSLNTAMLALGYESVVLKQFEEGKAKID